LTSIPRGIRNNNPGNIRLGDNWQGLAAVQTDGSFCQFIDVEHGIRAMAVIIRNTYYRSRKRNTVALIISSWAPTNENDTAAYISNVCKALGVGPDDIINLERDVTLATLIAAVIKHENGIMPYTTAQIVGGIRLAA